jgi:cell division protein FtsQ
MLESKKYFVDSWCFGYLGSKKGASRRNNGYIKAQSNKKYLSIILSKMQLLIGLLLLLAITVFAWQGIKKLMQIPVGEVQFSGVTAIDRQAEGATEEALYLLVFETLQEKFWDIDLNTLQRQLESHDWVRKASLRRSWPDKLVVGIDQHVPVARWNHDRLLSVSGELFEVDELSAFSHLPHFSAPGRQDAASGQIRGMVQRYNQLQKIFTAQRQTIRSMRLHTGGRTSLLLSSGTTIELSSHNQEQLLQRLIGLVEGGWLHSWSDIETADLRYTNGLAIRWATDAGYHSVVGSAAGAG